MFTIKRALMKKILDKKKKNQPFDYEAAEAFTLPTDGDGTINNSYYFSAHSAKKAQSLYVRLGLRDNGNAEVWVLFNNDKEIYSLEKMMYTLDTTPLKVAKIDGVWGFTFEGSLQNQSGKNVQAKLDFKFNSDKQPVDFFYHMPSKRTATAMAQDKWGKSYFAEVQKNNSVHYEQEGVLVGTVTIDDKKTEVELPCLRDHSYGRRVWGYMNNHVWLASVDNDLQLNFSMVSYPAMSILEVGHMRDGDSQVAFVTKASYDRNLVIQDDIPNELSLKLTVGKDKNVQVFAKLLHYKTYIFENGG